MSLSTMRRVPYLLLALLGLLLATRTASAQWDGFQFKGEAAYAEFSFADPATGIVTNIRVYGDDQSYNVKGQGGAPERHSTLDVAIEQYDPNCTGGGKLDAQAGGGGGDPGCFYRSLEGFIPCKLDACPGLAEDAFVVSQHQLDGAWLNATLTMVEWDSEGNAKQQDVTISLAWTPSSDVYQIHENWLRHTPPDVQTGHVNTRQRDAVATGTITFDGLTYGLESYFGRIADFQQVNT
jgi:hypothetical protein